MLFRRGFSPGRQRRAGACSEGFAGRGKIDRTIRPQRPHNSAPMTARFRLIDRTIPAHRPHDFFPGSGCPGRGCRTFGELFQKPPEFFKNVSAFRGKALGLFMKRIRRFYGHKKPRLFGGPGDDPYYLSADGIMSPSMTSRVISSLLFVRRVMVLRKCPGNLPAPS